MTYTHDDMRDCLRFLEYENPVYGYAASDDDDAPASWMDRQSKPAKGYTVVPVILEGSARYYENMRVAHIHTDLASLLMRCTDRRIIVHIDNGVVGEDGREVFSVEIGNKPGRPQAFSTDPLTAFVLACAAAQRAKEIQT